MTRSPCCGFLVSRHCCTASPAPLSNMFDARLVTLVISLEHNRGHPCRRHCPCGDPTESTHIFVSLQIRAPRKYNNINLGDRRSSQYRDIVLDQQKIGGLVQTTDDECTTTALPAAAQGSIRQRQHERRKGKRGREWE